jgi:hypothetical protein
VGFCAVVAGILLGIGGLVHPAFTIALCSGGTIAFAVAVFEMKRKHLGESGDERMRRITAHSGSFSWFLTYVVLLLLLWNDILGWIELTANAVLNLLMLTMILTMAGAQFVFKRRGDVE